MQHTKLSNERMQQVATTVFMHNGLASSGVRLARARSLDGPCRRMAKHADCCGECAPVSTAFDFIGRMVAGWHPIEERNCLQPTQGFFLTKPRQATQ